MKGRRPIVLRIENHDFYEHVDLERAKEEAQRLAVVHRGTCVVYVPVAVITPTPPTQTETLELPRELLGEEDLPY